MMTRPRTLAALFAGTVLAWSSAGYAQEPAPKDDALDKLLEKIDDPKPDAAPKPEGDKAPGVAKPAEASAPDAKPGDPAPAGEVSEKDKELDSLLEKLGETKEEGAADDKKGGPPMPGGPGDESPAPKPEAGEKDALEGQTKKLDEHLEDLTGRVRKKKDPKQQQGGAGQKGPLDDAIRKMDEAEERLKKTDTGEQTRKTQGEIVKQLDTILEQIRNAQSGSGKGMKMSKSIQQAGNKPGNKPGQPGSQPGNTGEGTGASKPLKPTSKSVLANNKDTWGDLPPYLREEMENVFKEEALPGKRLLVDRYFLTVSKKSLAPKE